MNTNRACQFSFEVRILCSRSFENCRRVGHFRVGRSSGKLEELVLTKALAGLVISMYRRLELPLGGTVLTVQETHPEPVSMTSWTDIPR